MTSRFSKALVHIALVFFVLTPAPALARWDDPPTKNPGTSLSKHELSLSIPGDPVLDPAYAASGDDFFVIDQILVGLFRLDEETGEPIAELAKSWTMSEDATDFTFELRSDAYWTDGRKVTAFEVRNGILRALAPGMNAPWAYVLDVIRNASEYGQGLVQASEVGIEVPDSTHITFYLNWPASFLPSILAHPITRPIPSDSADWGDPDLMVTNGPYHVTQWFHGNSLVLEKFKKFYGHASAKIRDVGIKILDGQVAWSAYLRGMLDTVVVPQGDWTAALDDPLLASQLHASPAPCTYYYGFNVDKAPFNDPLVRKAFIAAVDRQGLIDTVLGYAQQPALTFTPPGEFGHVDGLAEGIGIPYDPAQAQQWLADAGHPGGADLPPITLMFNTSEVHRQIAEYIQKSWMDILNVGVTVENMEWSMYLELLRTDPPQVWRLGWCMDHYDAYNFLHDSVLSWQYSAFGHWEDAEYRGLLDEAALTGDLSQRAELYKQAEEILVEDQAVMLPIYFYSTGVATQPCLERGYGGTSVGSMGGWIAEWRLKQCSK